VTAEKQIAATSMLKTTIKPNAAASFRPKLQFEIIRVGPW
jgi:hypothetical protein